MGMRLLVKGIGYGTFFHRGGMLGHANPLAKMKTQADYRGLGWSQLAKLSNDSKLMSGEKPERERIRGAIVENLEFRFRLHTQPYYLDEFDADLLKKALAETEPEDLHFLSKKDPQTMLKLLPDVFVEMLQDEKSLYDFSSLFYFPPAMVAATISKISSLNNRIRRQLFQIVMGEWSNVFHNKYVVEAAFKRLSEPLSGEHGLSPEEFAKLTHSEIDEVRKMVAVDKRTPRIARFFLALAGDETAFETLKSTLTPDELVHLSINAKPPVDRLTYSHSPKLSPTQKLRESSFRCNQEEYSENIRLFLNDLKNYSFGEIFQIALTEGWQFPREEGWEKTLGIDNEHRALYRRAVTGDLSAYLELASRESFGDDALNLMQARPDDWIMLIHIARQSGMPIPAIATILLNGWCRFKQAGASDLQIVNWAAGIFSCHTPQTQEDIHRFINSHSFYWPQEKEMSRFVIYELERRQEMGNV